jgi:hypothetical protein
MTDTNNSDKVEAEEIQEPTIGLDGQEEILEETGTTEEQPKEDSEVAEDATLKEAKGNKDEVRKKGVDLNKAIIRLSPEEQKAFKDFQAEFTRKSQTLSEREKQIAEYDEYVKSLQSDPEVAALFKSRAEKAAKSQEPDFSKMTDEEIFNYTVDKRVQSKLAELEKKMDSKYGTYIQQKLVDEGNKLINDFADAKGLDVEEARQMAKYALDHKLSLDETYKVFNYDKLPQQAKQEALADLDLKKMANLETGSVPTNVAPVNPDKMTFAEAAMAATKQTGINWDKLKTD